MNQKDETLELILEKMSVIGAIVTSVKVERFSDGPPKYTVNAQLPSTIHNAHVDLKLIK